MPRQLKAMKDVGRAKRYGVTGHVRNRSGDVEIVAQGEWVKAKGLGQDDTAPRTA